MVSVWWSYMKRRWTAECHVCGWSTWSAARSTVRESAEEHLDEHQAATVVSR